MKDSRKRKVKHAYPQVLFVACLVIVILLAVALLVTGWLSQPTQRACTMEAKLCPDGSAVGRSGPNCEFAACPAASNGTEPVYCTMDAKMCPDGSYVGRTGPNCEFSACPSAPAADSPSCQANPYTSCLSGEGCAVCPPCAECNSVSCHSIAFCKSIGFDENWYEQADPDCGCPQGYVKEGMVCNPQCYYSTPRCLAPSMDCSPKSRK